jgi:opacity protein-like surface antigen
MRAFVTFATTAITIAAASLPAAAADISRPPLMMVAPAYNWSGIYLGINGGGGWGRQDPLNIITDKFDSHAFDISGGMFGGTSGAQVQVANVVLGFESDIDWADISGSGTTTPAFWAHRSASPSTRRASWIGSRPHARVQAWRREIGSTTQQEACR